MDKLLAFCKYAKFFVAGKSTGHKALQGIYFDGKSVVVTDEYGLIMIDDYPSEKRLIHAIDNHLMPEVYPDFRRVIPDYDNVRFTISNIPEWIKALKPILQISEKGVFFKTKLSSNNDSGITIQTGNPAKRYYTTKIWIKENITFTYTLSAEYLLNALKFFKDAGAKNVVWTGKNTLNPIKLATDNGLTAVISPIRSSNAE